MSYCRHSVSALPSAVCVSVCTGQFPHILTQAQTLHNTYSYHERAEMNTQVTSRPDGENTTMTRQGQRNEKKQEPSMIWMLATEKKPSLGCEHMKHER